MKEKFQFCLGPDCPSHKTGRNAPHNYKGQVQCSTGTAIERLWSCALCGYEHTEPVPRRRCHKRTWPYHNDSAGVTFESESHEQAYCKANKLTPDG